MYILSHIIYAPIVLGGALYPEKALKDLPQRSVWRIDLVGWSLSIEVTTLSRWPTGKSQPSHNIPNLLGFLLVVSNDINTIPQFSDADSRIRYRIFQFLDEMEREEKNGFAVWILRKDSLEIEPMIRIGKVHSLFDILTCRNQNLVTRLQVQLDFLRRNLTYKCESPTHGNYEWIIWILLFKRTANLFSPPAYLHAYMKMSNVRSTRSCKNFTAHHSQPSQIVTLHWTQDTAPTPRLKIKIKRKKVPAPQKSHTCLYHGLSPMLIGWQKITPQKLGHTHYMQSFACQQDCHL